MQRFFDNNILGDVFNKLGQLDQSKIMYEFADVIRFNASNKNSKLFIKIVIHSLKF